MKPFASLSVFFSSILFVSPLQCYICSNDCDDGTQTFCLREEPLCYNRRTRLWDRFKGCGDMSVCKRDDIQCDTCNYDRCNHDKKALSKVLTCWTCDGPKCQKKLKEKCKLDGVCYTIKKVLASNKTRIQVGCGLEHRVCKRTGNVTNSRTICTTCKSELCNDVDLPEGSSGGMMVFQNFGILIGLVFSKLF